MTIGALCTINAKCNRSDYTHADQKVRLCRYHQEDIYNNYAKKIGVYTDAERYKECFYCGCPIDEHTKKNNVAKKRKLYR